MKKEEKKAQVTTFVILGFMMFVIVLFMLFLVNLTADQRAQREAIRTAQEQLDSSNVYYYVQTCLDAAVTEAIDEIMLQGGTLFEEQGGPTKINEPGKTHIPVTLDFSTQNQEITKKINTTYSITRINPCDLIGPFDTIPPRYPRHRTRLNELFSTYQSYFSCSLDRVHKTDYSGFFGYNNLTRLCYYESENQQNQPNFLSPCRHNFIRDNEENESIETLLKERTKELLGRCVDFDLLEDLQGHEYQLSQEEEPKIEIILNRNALSVRASYPFDLTFRESETTSFRHDFNYVSSLRITKLHNFALALLSAETKFYNFNINNFDNEFFKNRISGLERYNDPYFEIKIIEFLDCEEEDCEEYKYDRILKIQDKASQIGGRPLTFATAIRNRKPALDLISDHDLDLSYDILVTEGEELIISPEGYDPDNREVTYKYTGWKQDYNTICYDFDDCIEKEINEENYPDGFTTLMDSELFQETQREINYTTNETDIGLHEVTVTITDKEGLRDWQTVRVLVFQNPEGELNMDPPYQEMPENITSKEDPATIKGKLTNPDALEQLGDAKITKAEWILKNQEGNTILTKIKTDLDDDLEEEYEFNIPEESYNIQNISELEIKTPGEYLLELIITINAETQQGELTLSTNSIEMNIDVKQCIPVRNQNLIYPYSDFNPQGYGIGFGANHTCCEGNIEVPDTYELVNENTICFEDTWYGEFGKLKAKAQELMKVTKLEEYDAGELTTTPNNPTQNINSIYELTFKRNCDGERGNICAGDATGTISLQDQCDYNHNLDEQCTGPSINPIQNEMTCQDYTTTTIQNKRTFEKLFEKEGATGACLNEPKCSNIGTTGYDNDGNHLCDKAFCNNGECTRTFLNYCECDRDCGAICDSTYSFEWIDNTCRYGCNQNNCNFNNQRTTKCENPTNQPQPTQSTYCFVEDENDNDYGYCYYGVQCGPSGLNQIQGNYCLAEQLFEAEIYEDEEDEEGETVLGCLVNNEGTNEEDLCNNQGECDLTLQLFTCETGEGICTQTGPGCEEDNINPTTININDYETINYPTNIIY